MFCGSISHAFSCKHETHDLLTLVSSNYFSFIPTPQMTRTTSSALFASSVQIRPCVSRYFRSCGSIGTIPQPSSLVTTISSGFFSYSRSATVPAKHSTVSSPRLSLLCTLLQKATDPGFKMKDAAASLDRFRYTVRTVDPAVCQVHIVFWRIPAFPETRLRLSAS